MSTPVKFTWNRLIFIRKKVKSLTESMLRLWYVLSADISLWTVTSLNFKHFARKSILLEKSKAFTGWKLNQTIKKDLLLKFTAVFFIGCSSHYHRRVSRLDSVFVVFDRFLLFLFLFCFVFCCCFFHFILFQFKHLVIFFVIIKSKQKITTLNR